MNLTPLLISSWEVGLSFSAYHQSIKDLVANKKTSGLNQNQSFVDFTKLNASRMNRRLKATIIGDEIKGLITNKPIKILAITEAWCGDTAQTLPYFQRLSQETNIPFKLCFRDENEDLMNQFLTNESKSIPIVIFMNDAFEVLAQWGPRPSPLQKIVMDYKLQTEPKPSYDEFSINIQQWYNNDQSKTLENELITIIKGID
jgi:thiol-disulfide isomerase/thioredoxin